MYSITDLGTLPGFAPEALGLNASGTVVGTLHPSSNAAAVDTAFVWDRFSGMHALPGFGGESGACGVNDGGVIAGAARTNANLPQAVTWDAQRNITRLPPAPGALQSFTHSINNLGVVVGGCIKAGPVEVPLRWKTLASVPEEPGNNLGEPWNECRAVSGTGLAAGFTSGSPPSHGFLWKYASALIETLPQDPGNTSFLGINDAGSVVGSAHALPTRWDGGVAIALSLLAGFSEGEAIDINHGGQVVGDIRLQFEPESSRAVVWNYRERDIVFRHLLGIPIPVFSGLGGSQIASVRGLNELIEPTLGWDLKHATAINDAGQIIGTGTHAGQSAAFILSPPVTSTGWAIVAAIVQILFGGRLGNRGLGITPGGVVPIPPVGPPTTQATIAASLHGLHTRLAMAEVSTRRARGAVRDATVRRALGELVQEAQQILARLEGSPDAPE